MKKKVAILQNGLYWGGTDTFVINLCKGLNKEKYDVTVINTTDDKNQRENEILESGISIIHTHSLHGIKGKLIHFWRLYKYLKREGFDAFQTNIDLFNGPNLLIAWMARVPLRICHSHNSLQGKELKEGRSYSVKIYQKIMRWLCWHCANRRVGCSIEAIDFLYPGKDLKNLSYPSVIFNGIELDKYKLPNFNKEKFKKENGFNASKNIITIGHLIEQKNPLFIADLFSEFCKTNKDCNLIWIGDGQLKDQVLEILRNNNVENRVHFLSKRRDIPQLLCSADIFILPSNFEGLGIVAIEAQAAGLPVLLSDKVPSLADCGATQFLSIDDRKKPWITAINEILDGQKKLNPDPNKLKNFSIDKMIEQMTNIFES